MNKSDIIKAAEIAAELDFVKNTPSARDYKEYKSWQQMKPVRDLANALIAAAELLKQVEVVEAGSEPIVGDLVRFYEPMFALLQMGDTNDFAIIKEIDNGKFTYRGTKVPNNISDIREIIQRNGLPVITKGN